VAETKRRFLGLVERFLRFLRQFVRIHINDASLVSPDWQWFLPKQGVQTLSR
jgi:hypothetical protein